MLLNSYLFCGNNAHGVRTLIRTQYKIQEPLTCACVGRIILILKLRKKYIFFLFTKTTLRRRQTKTVLFEIHLIYIYLLLYYVQFYRLLCKPSTKRAELGHNVLLNLLFIFVKYTFYIVHRSPIIYSYIMMSIWVGLENIFIAYLCVGAYCILYI